MNSIRSHYNPHIFLTTYHSKRYLNVILPLSYTINFNVILQYIFQVFQLYVGYSKKLSHKNSASTANLAQFSHMHRPL
jgi:hypothetical protein